VFAQITAEGWLGSHTVESLNGYFVFIDPNTQTFYISALDDALTFDALETAEAGASPDKLVGQIVVGKALILFGEITGEIWQESGDLDFPFARNSGAHMDVGLLAAHTAKELDSTVFWLGRDQRGAGMVFRMEGYRPVRISTMAVEQKIQEVIRSGRDISQANAYTYQQDGHSYYVLRVPGLDTTWTFDAASGQWHERAELIDGQYAQHRGVYHAYAFGKHLVVADDEIIYEYDPDANDNAGDPLCRERVTPHMSAPSLKLLSFPRFELDCEVGHGIGVGGATEARVMLRYSNDGGVSFGSWRTATLGAVGERQARARFLRCGTARDRVWAVRCTDPVPFAIVNAAIEVE
jgi:hypothetical protein